jgi:multidrug efflux pump subunit AcrA (membrane-fusion protein)
VTGKLVAIDVKPGQRVAEGQTLAQLQNLDLGLEVAKLEGDLREREVRLRSLMRQSFRDHHAAAQISQVQEALKTVKAQLEEKTADQRRLRLVSAARRSR